jgi:fused signal recognition particle receptor
MTGVYILIGLVVVALLLYFVLGKRSTGPELKPSEGERAPKLPEKAPAKRASERPARKAEEKKAVEPSQPAAEPAPAAEEEPAVDVEVPAVEAEPALKRTPDVAGLRRGLARSRADEGFFGRLRSLFGAKKTLGSEIAADIEEVLLSSDVGVQTTQVILDRVRDALKDGEQTDPGRVWDVLREEAKRILSVGGKGGAFDLRARPTVVVMVGVNGSGKTTTIGKLATKLVGEGRTCLLAAGDTFRAAAVQQLVVWGDRVGCEVLRGKDGADPSSVLFDAIQRAKTSDVDVLLADTAGRLHTKANLMAEMQKIVKTAEKAMPGAPHEVLLVIDATNGQNALAQAKEFKESLPLTGLVLTKLDGTAKGGVILGICDTLGLPVRFVGLGERAEDLHAFSADKFVEALLGKESEASAA